MVVTANYRLGPLGFLAHPLLDAEIGPAEPPAITGCLTRFAALEWVQRNIAAFGGDPRPSDDFRPVRRLPLGFAAAHESPGARGCLRGAIAESGGPIIGSEYLSPAFNGDKANVGRMGQELARRLGSDQAADVLSDMRAKSAEEVVKAAACNTSLFADELFFAPVFDSWVLPDNPRTALAEGRIHAVPVITGSTKNEGALYLLQEKELTRQKYQAFFASRFGQSASQAREIFPAPAR